MANENDIPEDGDEVLVDIPKDKLPPVEVEVEDDTPEVDRGRRPAPGPSAIPEDDEIGAYTKGVQERLRRMRREYHDERRAKEEALRENERAIEFGKRILDQNKRLQKMLEEGQKSFKDVSTKSAENEISATRMALSQAIAAGDNEKIAELNERMARASARAEAATHMPEVKFEEPALPPQEVRQTPRVTISEQTQDWLDRNPWFDKDQRMTAIAMAAHERLIRDGVKVDTRAYFEGIDREVKEVFPDKFPEENRGGGSAPSRSPVAPTVRAPASNSGKPKLTLSEARLADKLGVPRDVYWAEKQKRLAMEQS